MPSNVVKRVLSTVVMVAIFLSCLFLGKNFVLGLLLIIGVATMDELFCNFFRKRRFTVNYFFMNAIFILPFVYFNFLDISPAITDAFVNAALVFGGLLLVYLFGVNMRSKILLELARRFPFLPGIYVLISFMGLAGIMHYSKWVSLVGVLLFIAYGMDTGAWFFGMNFGKRKLWETVSPKKTVEGLIGGMFTSGLLGGLSWYFLMDKISVLSVVLFMLIGVLSQLGDLIQSKIKRQFKIKDSSNLIPGHGGVYDRIDSLVFSAPFFVFFLRYIYFG